MLIWVLIQKKATLAQRCQKRRPNMKTEGTRLVSSDSAEMDETKKNQNE